MDANKVKKNQEREALRNVIAQWNANRLDLFALSEPNEDLEFHGVMRFYFQDAGQKVATKCIRVSSTAVTSVVITTLIEKFRPDMRMLSIPEYALYEIHENGEERKLGEEEKPLLVQLNWHRDDREGRFLLRRMDEKTHIAPQYFAEESQFKRKLSKREKREKKKKEKLQRIQENNHEKENGIAERLYSELPETSFTRSISNPEAVMRRRRQQKLEKKLQQFRSRDGGPDTGGTLKIYGETLCKDVPYKTLLLSIRDTAAQVVKEMLLKYGLDKEDPANYCLVQSFTMAGEGENKDSGANPGNEYILDDDECPLAVPMHYPAAKGTMTFHVRRRPPDYQPRKRKKKPKSSRGDVDFQYKDYMEKLPFFIELNPDGSDMLHGNPCKHYLHLNVTEVGSERSTSSRGQYLQLFGPNIYPRHCVIAHTEGIITVTPCSRDAETFVNGQRIFETTILQNGMTVRYGQIHTFRFVDPSQDERRLRHDSAPGQTNDFLERQSQKDDSSLHASILENSYDGENAENLSMSSHKEEPRMKKETRPPAYERYEHQRQGHDAILPAVLEFREDAEDSFLMAVLINIDPNMIQFKLAPTYILYMAARYRASTHYRPDITPNERALRLTALQNKEATMMQHVIHDKYNNAVALAFYMANASELLHFLKQDRHISAYSLDAQDLLADNVQIAFRSLIQCLQVDFQSIMPVFLDERDEPADEEQIAGEILAVLSSTMSLLRRCRVNAALTIQLFSQLFHFINMWLFNCLVGDVHPNYCNRFWGMRLKRRLAHVEHWAEKQGLELAADCHLSRIAQAAHLLQSPKSSPDDIAMISSACFKLNSLQLKALLEKYDSLPDEPRIPQELIHNVVKVAENTADELARTDGRDIKLREDADLQLPFLLPEDGYSCDIVRGVPAGLQEFLQPLEQANLCRLTIQPTSSGYWTIYMSDQDIHQGMHSRNAGSLGQHSAVHDLSQVGKEPEIACIKLKKSNNGMGLSIVAAKGVGQDDLGIYIKSVVKGGAADMDGRLQAGDQLLKVDGQSLVGLTQEKAAEYMTKTGPLVTLEVAKQGAIYHGLATLLNQPSPVIHRATGQKYVSKKRVPERYRVINSSYSCPSCFVPIKLVKDETDNFMSFESENGICPFSSNSSLERDLPYSFANVPASQVSSASDLLVSSALSNSLPRTNKSLPSGGALPSSQSRAAKGSGNKQDNEKALLQQCDTFNPALHAYKYSYVPVPASRTKPAVPSSKLMDSHKFNSLNRPTNRNSNIHRLSERDIPSRVSRDQTAEIDPRFLPRIHGSKSVPSLLNGPNPQEPMRMPSTGNLKPPQPQEVFNPGYSRASSTASMKSSEQHLAGKEFHGPYPEPVAAPQHQPSPHGASSSPPQEERFYQNISIYQQEPHGGTSKATPNFPDYPQSPTSVPKSPSYEEYRSHTHSPIPKAQPQQPTKAPNNYQQPPFIPPKMPPHHGHVDDRFNRSHRGSQSSLHRNEPPPQAGPRERPLSALVSQRERDQFMDAAPHGYPQKYGGPPPHQAQSHQAMRHNPARPYDAENKENAPYEHLPEGLHSPSQRIPDNRYGQFRETVPGNHEMQRSEKDFLRQEAKMEEMREEVRRREERSRLEREYPGRGSTSSLPHGTYPQRGYQNHGKIPPPHQQLPPSHNASEPNLIHAYRSQHPGHFIQKQPPPLPAPKPKTHYVQGPEKPQRQQQQHMHEMLMNGYIPPQDIPPERPPLPDEAHLYRDSPPPPPPPPSTTHPLAGYQKDGFKNGYMPNHRQGPIHPQSPIAAEKQAFRHPYYHPNQDPRLLEQSGKNYGGVPTDPTAAISPSPWEREEREKEQSKRLAEAHRMRDHEIEQLESCHHRTSKQEERLRTLRLEQEFQRRAEESKNEDDDENEDDDDMIERQNMLRKQEEMHHRHRRQEHIQNEHMKQPYRPPINEQERMEKHHRELPSSTVNTDEWLKRQQDIKNQRREQREEEERQRNLKLEEERIRQHKMEEVQRKREQERAAMRELQAARQAEERLLREAQRRQEEDMKMQKMMPYQAQPAPFVQQQYPNAETQQMPGHPIHNNYPPQPGQIYYTNSTPHSPGYGATQRLDNLVHVPPNSISGPPRLPPEMNQNAEDQYQHQGNYKYAAHPQDSYPQAHPPPPKSNSHDVIAPKRVSFHDTKLETAVPYESETKQHYKNNNNAYNSPANAKNTAPTSPVQKEVVYYTSPPNSPQGTTFSTGISPGVIGTQEVYRDPRKKIEAQRQSQTGAKNPGPEKLSFKEKMKMFALETGEPESPRDKVKISRAQRDIETNLNGSEQKQ